MAQWIATIANEEIPCALLKFVTKLCARRTAGEISDATMVVAPLRVAQELQNLYSTVENEFDVKQDNLGLQDDDVVICTDACKNSTFAGYGGLVSSIASSNIESVSDIFSREESLLDINTLEVLAVLKTLQLAKSSVAQARRIVLFLDNTCAMYCLRKRRSNAPQIDIILETIFELLHGKDVLVIWLPSEENPSDNLSRGETFEDKDQVAFERMKGWCRSARLNVLTSCK